MKHQIPYQKNQSIACFLTTCNCLESTGNSLNLMFLPLVNFLWLFLLIFLFILYFNWNFEHLTWVFAMSVNNFDQILFCMWFHFPTYFSITENKEHSWWTYCCWPLFKTSEGFIHLFFCSISFYDNTKFIKKLFVYDKVLLICVPSDSSGIFRSVEIGNSWYNARGFLIWLTVLLHRYLTWLRYNLD